MKLNPPCNQTVRWYKIDMSLHRSLLMGFMILFLVWQTWLFTVCIWHCPRTRMGYINRTPKRWPFTFGGNQEWVSTTYYEKWYLTIDNNSNSAQPRSRQRHFIFVPLTTAKPISVAFDLAECVLFLPRNSARRQRKQQPNSHLASHLYVVSWMNYENMPGPCVQN